AFAPYSLSRRVPSATRPPLLGKCSILEALAGSERLGSRYARAALTPPPEIDREALRARYDAILAPVTPPFAFVDLDAMRRNAAKLAAHSGGLPIRVASKSVRSVPVLRRIFELDSTFRG